LLVVPQHLPAMVQRIRFFHTKHALCGRVDRFAPPWHHYLPWSRPDRREFSTFRFQGWIWAWSWVAMHYKPGPTGPPHLAEAVATSPSSRREAMSSFGQLAQAV
jgi:hypothetical protein